MLHRHAKNERSRVRARQQVFVFRLHRFTGMAFFVYTQGVVGEGFHQKASPFVHRRPPPLKACTHTEPMGGEKRGRGTEKRPIYAGLPARFFTPAGEGENRKGEP